ncbi:MAG TPA: glycosyltransferase [Ktedonobacterales bacterium]|jgi:D-inositol-3-phosphate glycosyltransferase|nr:glycosyltransferase [Ktedonobacterales bacterium]
MFSLHTSPIAQLGRTRDAGGMNVYIRELSRELGRGGMYVDIFTRRSQPETPEIQQLSERVRLITVTAGPAALLPPSALHPYVSEFTCRVAHFAQRNEHPYDMVHSHYWLSAAAAAPLARAWDVPHVTMFHTVERLKAQQQGMPLDGASAPKDGAAAIRIESEGSIATSADCVIVSTELEGEQLRRLYGLSPSHTRVIPCGVDLDAFTPITPELRAQARRELDLGETPTLLFVGRLDPIKGIDLLLESVALLRTPARLLVVGGDPAGDPEVERLRAHAAALGLADRVRFPGAVPQRNLPTYYHAADAVVVSSRYESFGLVAVEALACGAPVVASAAGGLPSIVRDGENGLLVRWRSPQAFAEQIDLLLSDDTLRERAQASARASVERFDWRHIGDRVRDLYQDLTTEGERAAVACSCF